MEYDSDKQSVRIVEKGSLDNKKANKPHGELLTEIRNELRRYQLLAHRLSESGKQELVFVRERGFSRFAAETQALYKVIGVADLTAWENELMYQEIAPVSVKKWLTGNAKAKKDAVAAALIEYVGQQSYACDDESDAVAGGIAWLLSKVYIKQRLA